MNVNQEIQELKDRFSSYVLEFDFYPQVESLQGQINRLEKQLELLKESANEVLDRLETWEEKMEKRFSDMEDMIDTCASEYDLNSAMDDVEVRLEDLEDEVRGLS